MTSAENARLVVSFEARLNQYFKQLEKMQRDTAAKTGAVAKSHDRAAADVQRAWDKPIHLRGLDTARKEIASFRTSLLGSFGAGFAGGAVAGLVAQLPGAIRNATKSLAELRAEAARAGVAVGPFQELAFAASQTKVPIDALVDGLKELNLRADEFLSTGKGPAAEAFARLGYGADELRLKLKDPIALFGEIIERLKAFDAAAQIRILDEVFGGTGGERFSALLQDGVAGIDEMRARARELGVVLSDDVIDRAAELDARFNEVAATIDSRVKVALVGTADVLAGIADQFTSIESTLADIGNASAWTTLRRFMGVTDEEAAKGNLRFQLQRGATNVPDYSSINGGTSAPAEITIAPDKLAGLDDKLEVAVRQMVADAAAAGHEIVVTSALRSTERQRQLWQEALAKYGSPAAARKHVAPPGSSRHEKGEAVDIAFPDRASREWVAANMGAYGLGAPVASEQPLGTRHAHLEAAGSRSGDRSTATTEAERQAESIRRVVDELRFEGEQIKRNSVEQDVAAALRQAGVDAASKEGQAIAALVRENYALEASRDAATRAQERANEATEEGLGAARDFAGTLLHGLKSGKSFTDSLADAINRLSDRLMDSALDSLFKAPSAGSAGGLFSALFGGGSTPGAPMQLGAGAGGLLGGILLPGILHGGGIAGHTAVPGRAVPSSAFANAPRLHSGVRPGEYAAILEEGERVSTELQTKREGAVMGALTSFAKSGARSRGGGPAVSMPTTYNIDARGSDMKREDFEAIVARNNRELVARIPGIVQRHQLDRG